MSENLLTELYCSSEDTNDSVGKKVSKTYLWNQEFKWVGLCTPTVQQSGKMIASNFCSQGGGRACVCEPPAVPRSSPLLSYPSRIHPSEPISTWQYYPITHFAQFSSPPVSSPTFLPPIFSPTFPPIFYFNYSQLASPLFPALA